MAHIPKPCNHKHPSKTKPTTKGTHPISYVILVLFAFPLLSFCKESSYFLTLLEILSYATTMFATGMQLPIACNYLWFFLQLQWIFAPFLGVYATMVQL